MQVSRPVQIGIIILVALWLGYQPVVDVVVDYWWFSAAGYDPIFFTKLKTNWPLGDHFYSICRFYLGELTHLSKGKQVDLKELQSQFSDLTLPVEQFEKMIGGIRAAVIVLPSLLLASVAAQNWLYVLAFLDKEPFEKRSIQSSDMTLWLLHFSIACPWIFSRCFCHSNHPLFDVVVGTIVVREGLLSGRLHQLSPQAARQAPLFGWSALYCIWF